MSLLHKAAASGNLVRLKELLTEGTDPNAPDESNGWSALHYAAMIKLGGHPHAKLKNCEACMSALLAAGANPNAKTPVQEFLLKDMIGEQTPLHFAVKRGYAVCVSVLLEAGADPNAKDISGTTPLLFAAEQTTSRHIECLAALVSAGAVPIRPLASDSPAIRFLLRNDPAELPKDYDTLPKILPYLKRDDAWWRLALERKFIARHREAIRRNRFLPPSLAVAVQ